MNYSILLGRSGTGIHMLPGTEHVCLHARSRSGKTSNFSVPNLFQWPGSAIVLDIKGEIFKATAGHRARNLGQDIYVFDPTSRDGRSHCWNAFDAVDRASIDRFDQIQRQTFMMFPEGDGSSNSERFWEPAGRSALTAVCNLIAETPGDPFTMAHVLHLLSRGDYHEVLRKKIKDRRNTGPPYSRLTVEGISDFLSGHPDMVESIRKAQPVDSLVLTPTGFVPIGNLEVGDLVQTPSGLISLVDGVFPQGEKEVYRITFHDGRTVECCDEHLWKVSSDMWGGERLGRGRRKKQSACWRIKSLAEIMPMVKRGQNSKRNVAIPLISPYSSEFPPRNLPIPPYVLGALLGDGCFKDKAVLFTTADSFMVSKLQSQVFGLGYELVTTGGNLGYDFRVQMLPDPREKHRLEYGYHHHMPLRQALAELGLWGKRSHDKFVPPEYKQGSVAQRVALLQGLLDTEGWITAKGVSVSFTSTSEQLAMDVREIAWSLGALASISSRQTFYSYKGVRKQGRVSWNVCIAHPNITTLVSLPRKVAKCKAKTNRWQLRIKCIEPIGKKPAVCISVDHPDHLYITNDYVVTHNTVTTRLAPWQNPRTAAATQRSDFDLRDFRRRPMTLYVRVAPGNIPRMRPLLRLLFEQFVNLNTDTTPEEDQSLRVPVLLWMDEFARLQRMQTVAESLQFLAGFGVRVAIVVQNKAQIKHLYGANLATDIFDNVGAEIVFGTGDIELARELETRLGSDTVTYDAENMPRWMAWLNIRRQSVTRSPHKRPLKLLQEILRLPRDQQIILRPGMMPMLTERICWYEDPHYLSLVSPPPIIPRLQIDVPLDDGSIVIPHRQDRRELQPDEIGHVRRWINA